MGYYAEAVKRASYDRRPRVNKRYERLDVNGMSDRDYLELARSLDRQMMQVFNQKISEQ